MFTRLTHAAIAFAITAVVYQVYVLVAAPLIEPQVARKKETRVLSDEERREALRVPHKYRDVLTTYFPADHWTLTQPPVTVEYGQTMLLIDKLNHPRDDGQIHVKKCALLFFPSGRVRGEAPPRDAVVLEAPQGAILQMDKGLRQGSIDLGRMQWGELTGQITVRSDMREPGPQDDLWIVTRNLSLTEDLIYTKDVVDMRLGPHRGRGRELEIRLVATERGRENSSGFDLGNIDTLEMLREVEVELSPGNVQLGAVSAAKRDVPSPAPPIKVTCNDRFRFDFSKQIASFNENVRLSQLYPQGELDELSCQKLAIYFANGSQSFDNVPSDSNKHVLNKFAIGSFEALGSASFPVILNAQSRQATASCERLRIEPEARRITLDFGHNIDHGQKVRLAYEGHEIEASQIQYTAPPRNSPQRVGRLLAAGSGSLRALASNKPGAEPLDVRWSENLRLRRINGQPVLTLNGRPKLDMVGVGQLWADHVDLFLRESAIDGSEAELLPGDIVPDRLVASGQIAIDSEQIHGKVKELEVRFDYAGSDLQLTNPNGGESSTAPSRRARSRLGRRNGSLKRAYDVTGEKLDMLVTVRLNEPEITSLDIDGRVVFNESATQTTNKEPLQVEADHLHITNADSPLAELTLSGRPATITASGMSIRTENLKVNRGSNRAAVKAPGQIEMLVDRDLSGKHLATPQVLTITWQGGMELVRDLITFTDKVHVQTAEGKLDTQKLAVKLSSSVRFDGAVKQQPLEIAQLQCSGGAEAIFSQRDALGLASVQTIKLEDTFTVNLQTGDILGTGPGTVESVHLSKGKNPFAKNDPNPLQARNNPRGRLASANPQKNATTEQRLRFLGVQFVTGVQGNLNRRQVKVFGDVETAYGPVDSWEQRLSLSKRGMPGPNTLWISCQSLSVAESPLARLNRNNSGLGPIELEATGKVTIEGPTGERGNFTAIAQLAKYDQSKKTFVLEGTNVKPASIILQQYRGGPTSPTSARKIIYYQETGNVEIGGLNNSQFRQLAPPSQ